MLEQLRTVQRQHCDRGRRSYLAKRAGSWGASRMVSLSTAIARLTASARV